MNLLLVSMSLPPQGGYAHRHRSPVHKFDRLQEFHLRYRDRDDVTNHAIKYVRCLPNAMIGSFFYHLLIGCPL